MASEARASPLAFSVRDYSRHLRSSVHKGSRASFEHPTDGDTDRYGDEEPHLEDLDDHGPLPLLGSCSSRPIDTLAGEVDGEMKKARRVA
jgi:hypothetical protein